MEAVVIPVPPSIPAHSIIPVKASFEIIEDGNDGVVAYTSAHIDEAASKLVVRWNLSLPETRPRRNH